MRCCKARSVVKELEGVAEGTPGFRAARVIAFVFVALVYCKSRVGRGPALRRSTILQGLHRHFGFTIYAPELHRLNQKP